MATVLEKPAPQSINSRPANSGDTRRPLIIGVALTVLMFCTLEALARLIVVGFMPSQSRSQFFDRKFYLATRAPAAGKRSILFIGSSFGSSSVYADLISAELQRQGFDFDVRNLCSILSLPIERLFLLNSAIKAGAKPALVVCDLVPQDFISFYQRANGRGDERFFTESATGLAYYDTSNSPKAIIARLLMHKCYLYTFRSFLSAFLIKAPEMILHPEQRYEGFQLTDSTGMFDQAGLSSASYSSGLGWTPFWEVASAKQQSAQSDAQIEYWLSITASEREHWFDPSPLKPILAYCQSRRIPLVLVWHPWYPLPASDLQKQKKANLPQAEDFLERIRRELHGQPNVYVLDCHAADKNALHFHDCCHEDAAGAIEHSEQLTNVLLKSPLVQYLQAAKRQ
ncbi:MAG TPA: hypothetical protein V6C81_10945 [Planktothrix sp.]|jgi:hypothetical protein